MTVSTVLQICALVCFFVASFFAAGTALGPVAVTFVPLGLFLWGLSKFVNR